MSADQLPEGTDHVVNGAGVSEDSSDTTPPISAIGNGDDVKGAFFERMDELRGQANDRARELAQTGKERATDALDSLAKTVEEAAAEIDEKLGSQYGDYARRAAEHLGGFTDSFRDKDIDDLFNDARDFVKKSPAVAIGAAAALGFVVARLARSSMPESPGKDAPKA